MWVRYQPRAWASPATLWIDVVSRRLGAATDQASRGTMPETQDLGGLDDVVYLPPVAPGSRSLRDELVMEAVRLGVPAVVQVGWAEAVASPPTVHPTLLILVDPLALILDQRLEDFDRLPANSHLLYPLISGLTSKPSSWDEVCARLARVGASAAYPIALDLTSEDRRRLGGALASERAYRELFHGTAPSKRDFARVAAGHGLLTLPVRPLPNEPERSRTRRSVAGHLSVIGELWLRLGRRQTIGQDFFRAARKVEQTHQDIEGLHREGNLRVFDWLEGRVGDQVAELLETGKSSLEEELRREYLADHASEDQSITPM